MIFVVAGVFLALATSVVVFALCCASGRCSRIEEEREQMDRKFWRIVERS